MECPYCGNDLLGLSWKYWLGSNPATGGFLKELT